MERGTPKEAATTVTRDALTETPTPTTGTIRTVNTEKGTGKANTIQVIPTEKKPIMMITTGEEQQPIMAHLQESLLHHLVRDLMLAVGVGVALVGKVPARDPMMSIN